nr:bifunctional monodehydroascorbate reductase and carbonic anhydrase nectarin-3-like [Ipomoea batatas]
MLSSRAKLFSIAFLLLSVTHHVIKSQQVDGDWGFSYDENSERGPSHWGELRPEWWQCGAGKMQTPIDLESKPVVYSNLLGLIRKYYITDIATLQNRGYDMMLSWPLGRQRYISIDGIRYSFRLVHWHSPSEHVINGTRYDLEAHLVHVSNDGKIAVLAVLYQIGETPDRILSLIEDDLKELAATVGVKKDVGYLDPNLLQARGRRYYRYMGSLTTPPCTEGVVWTVIETIRSVTKEQVALIRNAIHDGEARGNRTVISLNLVLVFGSPTVKRTSFFPVFRSCSVVCQPQSSGVAQPSVPHPGLTAISEGSAMTNGNHGLNRNSMPENRPLNFGGSGSLNLA